LLSCLGFPSGFLFYFKKKISILCYQKFGRFFLKRKRKEKLFELFYPLKKKDPTDSHKK
jgi:hypothetical protein